MTRSFVPDDYETPLLESEEQAMALGQGFRDALQAICLALSEQILQAGLAAEYFEHRKPDEFAGTISGMTSCVNALLILSDTINAGTVALPRPSRGQGDG